jgi:hypothetical protein
MSSEYLAFDPSEVEIGDAIKTDDTKYAIAFAVTDVDPENERVKVYSPTMEQTVHRWVDMDSFSVHMPNDDVTTDADREEWLNDTLPQGYRSRGDERQELEYVLCDDGHVTQVPANE